MDCQFGALGALADEIDGIFEAIEAEIQAVQNKIKAEIAAGQAKVEAELNLKLALIQAELAAAFPQINAIIQYLENGIALPEEIANIVAIAQDAAAFASEVERLKDKYEDADLDLLKDPRNISNLLRDLQGDLTGLCDLVPTYVKNPETGESELRGRGNSKIEALSRPNIDVKSLLTKEGRKLAIKQVTDSLKSIRVTYEDNGSGQISKESENRYGW